ncbi:MAG: hypothetical protein R3F11_23990 [Verrucomicrobiales bacterium]
MKPTADIEENEIAFQGRAVTRRRFLRRSVFGGTAAWTLPAFLNNMLLRLDAGAADNPPSGAGGPISGHHAVERRQRPASTSLIPYTNSHYVNARPAMALSPAAHSAIAIGGAPALDGASGFDEPVALHPLLGNFGQFWEDGDLAVINGVGYPNPNLSHFTSFDYYHSAKPNEFVTDGWLGRFFDHQCAGCPPQTAMHLSNGTDPGAAFGSRKHRQRLDLLSQRDGLAAFQRTLGVAGGALPQGDRHRPSGGQRHLRRR